MGLVKDMSGIAKEQVKNKIKNEIKAKIMQLVGALLKNPYTYLVLAILILIIIIAGYFMEIEASAEENTEDTAEVTTDSSGSTTIKVDSTVTSSGSTATEFIPVEVEGEAKREGAIYYSQADLKWGSIPYTITGATDQTIKSSGCGPTSAAMVVSSLTSTAVTPDVMAKLYVDNGFRTKDRGTYHGAFEWTATKYNLEYAQLGNLNETINYLRNGYYIVASCKNGLFTSGGHFIVIYGINNDTLLIYDPAWYSSKTEGWKSNGLTVDEKTHTTYCSIETFKSKGSSWAWHAFKAKELY